MAAEIRLLATDLDGTVAEHSSREPLYDEFASQIRALKEEHDARWAIFSGRSRRRVLRLLAPLRDLGINPDFLVLRYAYVYRFTPLGYIPCLFWNMAILWQLIREPLAARRMINEWYESAVFRFPRMYTLIRSQYRLRLRFDVEQDAMDAAESLRELIAPFRHMRVFRAGVEVEAMPVPYIKGLVLNEMQRRLGIDPCHVLAIGNGRNDLSMVDPSVSGRCGCPANSDSRIVQAVHEAGGHLARHRSLAGVVEIIQAHRSGVICSDLPPEWKVPRKEMSIPERLWSHEQRRRKVYRIAALVVVLYMILVAFASFDLIPFSGWIMKPYELLISLLAHVSK
jgi:hydroxymethylpyrimidine pyrophosphatase-like HAD family hydrolase